MGGGASTDGALLGLVGELREVALIHEVRGVEGALRVVLWVLRLAVVSGAGT